MELVGPAAAPVDQVVRSVAADVVARDHVEGGGPVLRRDAAEQDDAAGAGQLAPVALHPVLLDRVVVAAEEQNAGAVERGKRTIRLAVPVVLHDVVLPERGVALPALLA